MARIETNTNLTGKLARLPGRGRVNRNPQHRFQVRFRPWQIQPVMIAPVLPGETLNNMLLQVRTVTDPIKNPLIGWWLEHHFFYVRLSDLDGFESDILPGLLNQATGMAGINEAAATPYYHFGSAPNWAKLCLKRVCEVYFREQEADGLTQVEDWDDYLIDGMPAAQIGLDSGLDSLQDSASWEAANAADPVGSMDLDADADGTITMSEFEQQRARMNLLNQLEVTGQSYENFIRAYGATAPAEEKPDLRRPELLRSIREWSYPTNTVNPSNGVPASAVSWSVAERADKARFFREPGFILGVTIARPKVYLQGQAGALVGAMCDQFSWLPGILNKEPLLSFKEYATATGPVPGSAADYMIDVRDLLVHGDQFLNFSLTETDGAIVGLPTTAREQRYPSTTDADELFTTSTAGAGKVRSDGVVHLTIKGAQVDSSSSK